MRLEEHPHRDSVFFILDCLGDVSGDIILCLLSLYRFELDSIQNQALCAKIKNELNNLQSY